MNTTTKATTFEEAVLALVTTTPALVSDLVEILNEQGWRGGHTRRRINRDEVERVVREYGGHVRSRVHGAGCAVYVATVPFTEIVDFKGYTHTVSR